MEYHFVDIKGFNGRYEISIEEPYIIRDKLTYYIIDEWHNNYGDVGVILNGEFYLITELISNLI